ncbi:TPA: serine--tRNA ligase [Candidatus Poribacteria bacterium]|nr:serine--tRNA ligase [Candidatus Poribacteria bacterium]
MLDLKYVRENVDKVKEMLHNRNLSDSISLIDELVQCDEKRKSILPEVEELRRRRNEASKEIAELKRSGKDAPELVEELREVRNKIQEMEEELSSAEKRINDILLIIPNMPHSSVPIGEDPSKNVVVRTWGEMPKFSFEPAPHWEIAETLGIIEFDRASRLAGSNFVLYKGLGAKLERALINFMLDLHTDVHGYIEIFPPFIANRTTMTGSGQLPKFEGDMYQCDSGIDPKDDLFLIPTAEVQLASYHNGEILNGDLLPLKYTAYTACFRREAGAYGRDTRGLVRIHQFDKVEMFKFTKPEDSFDELESMVKDAEEVLQLLKLPYRVSSLCTADISSASAKTYDIEVWMPGLNRFQEVSSCSNCTDYQARRSNTRFRRGPGKPVEFVHMLNGSGVAMPRTVIAILENFQQSDGSVIIPEVLRPYMKGVEKIG